MKKIKDFWRQYRDDGEADMEIEISLWHVIIPICLIVMAILIFK